MLLICLMITLNTVNIHQSNDINGEKNTSGVKINDKPAFSVDFTKVQQSGVLHTKLTNLENQIVAKSSGFINWAKNKLFKDREAALGQARQLISDIKAGNLSDLNEINNRLQTLSGNEYYGKRDSDGQNNRGVLLRTFAEEIRKFSEADGIIAGSSPYYGLNLAIKAVRSDERWDPNTEEATNFNTWINQNRDAFKEMYLRIFTENEEGNKMYP